jgi:hypothetical protein
VQRWPLGRPRDSESSSSTLKDRPFVRLLGEQDGKVEGDDEEDGDPLRPAPVLVFD